MPSYTAKCVCCSEWLSEEDYTRWLLRRYWTHALCNDCRQYICPDCHDSLSDEAGKQCKWCAEAEEEARQAQMRGIAEFIGETLAYLPSMSEFIRRVMARNSEAM